MVQARTSVSKDENDDMARVLSERANAGHQGRGETMLAKHGPAVSRVPRIALLDRPPSMGQGATCAKFVPLCHSVKQEISELRRICECGKRRK